ncbi:MAG: helicase, partial [Firmicutes bacterium]|nr:helicase [Bacillota bacterium]
MNEFKSKYSLCKFDLIVVDECSTISNEDILCILGTRGSPAFVFVGDIYQIESIQFGSWFELSKNIVPENYVHELLVPYRTKEEKLLDLWSTVRKVRGGSDGENTVLEKIVRGENYSHIIDSTIFAKKDEDEIILCLNYNGLYGLNNINKLLQGNNKNKAY